MTRYSAVDDALTLGPYALTLGPYALTSSIPSNFRWFEAFSGAMRHPFMLLSALLVCSTALGSNGAVSASPSPKGSDHAAPTVADIQRDLVLAVQLRSPVVIKPNASIKLDISVRNRSKQRTHHVIRPGEGSAVGWRAPHVFYTAERKQADGTWTRVPEAIVGQCGLSDLDWTKDVVPLAPGTSLILDSWIDSPDMSLELGEPGVVRIFVHYAYRPSKTMNADNLTLRGPIARVPEYELVSKPVTIRVIKPKPPASR